MWGLFTKKTTDEKMIAEAAANAVREPSDEQAAERFLSAIRQSDAVMSELRETCRKTVDEMCVVQGIRNEIQCRAIHAHMATVWEQMLLRTAHEYVRDCRAKGASKGDVPGALVIEFAAF